MLEQGVEGLHWSGAQPGFSDEQELLPRWRRGTHGELLSSLMELFQQASNQEAHISIRQSNINL